MGELLRALGDPALAFLRYGLAAGLLASVALGILGSYVVARRISYIAAGIAHSALGGIGAALYLQDAVGVEWFSPMLGAVLAALLAALLIGAISLYARQREDTVISGVWAVGMSVGLLLLYKTPGNHNPMSYLFGDIMYISRQDLWIVAGLDAVVIGLALVFHNKLLAVCFDEEFAELRGIRARLVYIFLLLLIALTVVLLVRVVGIVMVIALLTLPAAAAGHFAGRLWQMMLGGSLLSMAFIVAGLAAGYQYDLPFGPTIIVVAAVVYLAVSFGMQLWRRLA